MFAQSLLELLVEGPTIRKYLVAPYLLQIWSEFIQRRKEGLGDVNVLFHDLSVVLPVALVHEDSNHAKEKCEYESHDDHKEFLRADLILGFRRERPLHHPECILLTGICQHA